MWIFETNSIQIIAVGSGCLCLLWSRVDFLPGVKRFAESCFYSPVFGGTPAWDPSVSAHPVVRSQHQTYCRASGQAPLPGTWSICTWSRLNGYQFNWLKCMYSYKYICMYTCKPIYKTISCQNSIWETVISTKNLKQEKKSARITSTGKVNPTNCPGRGKDCLCPKRMLSAERQEECESPSQTSFLEAGPPWRNALVC